jgi:hypothetical protein
LVVLTLLLTACSGGVPKRGGATATPPPASGAVAGATLVLTQGTSSCTPARQRDLVEQFFDAYNRRDLPRLFALLSTEQRLWQYFDHIEGQQPVDIHGDRDALGRHLRARFQVADQFTLTSIEVATNTAPGMTNPTVAFARTWTEGTYYGNAKLVCTLGQLQDVVMTSSPAASR